MSKSGRDEDDEECKVCPYCSGDEVTDEELLNFALERLKMDKVELALKLKARKQDEIR
jgi:hypothetical protein